jgi:asparagine synthase (glutamine-hydrolysing)
MCGIAGFQGAFDTELLDRMSATIAHRGPDDHGTWSDPEPRIGLAHRRLSIIDLSPLGHQPMSNGDGALHITYNGEIYNHRELKAKLESSGHRFRGSSDTEVLLGLYQEYGTDMLDHLNGMFAFAIWDARIKRLFLARDQLGVKPLYYHSSDDGFLFASEMKAILQNPSVSKEIDPIALEQHLAFLWSIAPRTLLKSIQKLEPGFAIEVVDGRIVRKWSYYNLPYGQDPDTRPEAVIAEELRSRLETAVDRQMVSDVPVGAFLSGGLDSSAIVAMMRKIRPDYSTPCYSIGFEEDVRIEGNVDDLPYARRVAQHVGASLRTIEVRPDIIDHVDKMIYHLDEPHADPAPINAMMIAERARNDGIGVLLSGAGGDDIFTGYRRHYALGLERVWGWMPTPARKSLAWITSSRLTRGPRLRRFRRAFEYAGMDSTDRMASYFLWSGERTRRALLSPGMSAELTRWNVLQPMRDSLKRIPGESHRMNQMLYLEAKHFLADHNLPYTDKMTMAHGVESRVPLLDLDLVDFAARIPSGLKQRGQEGKYIFKRAMEPYLPRDVIYRPKTGFGAPLRQWIRNDLASLVDEVLSEDSIRRRGLFEPTYLRRLIELDRAGVVDAAYVIFAAFTIEIWAGIFLDQIPSAASIASTN